LQYFLDVSTLEETKQGLMGKVNSPANDKQLDMRISVLSSGSVRLKITEEKERWQVGFI
jgi:hypothetical protein